MKNVEVHKGDYVKLKDRTVVYVTDLAEQDDILIGDIDDHGGRRVFHTFEIKKVLTPGSRR